MDFHKKMEGHEIKYCPFCGCELKADCQANSPTSVQVRYNLGFKIKSAKIRAVQDGTTYL